MKAYIHTGPGHYIGSCVIVIADNEKQAAKLIGKELSSMGLHDEDLNIRECDILPNSIIYKDSGDY